MRTTRNLVGRLARDTAAGVVAGAVATAPMSGLMLVAQRSGLMGRQPPQEITDGALDAVGADLPEGGRRALAGVAHVGFGAAGGVPFVWLHRVAPARVPRPALGALYGLGVWASAYLGWVPAAGLMPPAHRDHRGRPRAMIAAHLVYGSVLGACTARLLRAHGDTPPAGGVSQAPEVPAVVDLRDHARGRTTRTGTHATTGPGRDDRGPVARPVR